MREKSCLPGTFWGIKRKFVRQNGLSRHIESFSWFDTSFELCILHKTIRLYLSKFYTHNPRYSVRNFSKALAFPWKLWYNKGTWCAMKREVAEMSRCQTVRGISVEYVRVNRANQNAFRLWQCSPGFKLLAFSYSAQNGLNPVKFRRTMTHPEACLAHHKKQHSFEGGTQNGTGKDQS